MHCPALFSVWTATVLGQVLYLSIVCNVVWAAPVTIVDNGPSANRVDIVFIGDGYTQADLDAGVYDQHIDGYLDHVFATSGFLADPFPRYEKFFNVHKLTVVSNESGADIPSQSIFKDTALDATYDSFGIDRALTISESDAGLIRDQELAGTGITADLPFATVNHSKYGGFGGGNWSIYAGANSDAREIALHESGHVSFNLADEYATTGTTYTGPDPPFRNITTDPAGQKWSHWLGFDDPRGANLDIGAFEGAGTYQFGLYRPSQNSKMRNLGLAFDAVSREAAIHGIYAFVDPLDDWLDNSQTVVDVELWADVVDPDVIRLEWYVDDVLVPGATSEQFNAREFGFGPGNYDVRVRALDEILDHSFSGDLLDLVRSDLELLEQSVSWSLTLNPTQPGDYNGDQLVNGDDYDLWQRTFGSRQLLAADGNSDGTVNAADYVIWRFFSAASGSASDAPVPEATTCGLVVGALLVCGACRRPGAPLRMRLP
jgi:hypothetical protein